MILEYYSVERAETSKFYLVKIMADADCTVEVPASWTPIASPVVHGLGLKRFTGMFEDLGQLQKCTSESTEGDFDRILERLRHWHESPIADDASLPQHPSLYTDWISSRLSDETQRIFLCRHGETEPNNQRVLQGSGLDESLNQRGFDQAKFLAERLSCFPVDVIVSSDLKVRRVMIYGRVV